MRQCGLIRPGNRHLPSSPASSSGRGEGHGRRSLTLAACAHSGAHSPSLGKGVGRINVDRGIGQTRAQKLEIVGEVLEGNATQAQGSMLVEPLSLLDVDQELWTLLDLCSDDELEALYNILHSSSPFSPVVKSLVAEAEPPLISARGRRSIMHKVESRFRFLAADHEKLLQGKRPGYRETLLAIRDRIDVQCSSNLSTYDLETEIFLHILHNCVEFVQADADPDPGQAAAIAMMSDGDGMSSARPAQKGMVKNWTERLTAPLRFGFKEIAPTLAKLGSVLTISAMARSTVQQLTAQLIGARLQYQAALKAATGGFRGAVANWSKQAVLEAAQRGLSAATARYSAVQGALAFLGPLMWAWLALDLALKSIGTDYARIVRAVFLLAQVRLVRTKGFSNPKPVLAPAAPAPAPGAPGGSSSPARAAALTAAPVVAATIASTVAAAAVVATPGKVVTVQELDQDGPTIEVLSDEDDGDVWSDPGAAYL